MSDYTSLDPTQEASALLSEGGLARVEELCLRIDADLDSWFSTSVACCDACFDEYVAAWPNAYRHDEAFRNIMDFSLFYSGSKKVRSSFTEDEFNRLLPYIACPRCLQSIGPNLYPYELPFSVPKDWEAKQKSLSDRAANTPFLLLQEPFAREIYDNLSRACSAVKSSDLPINLFRGRTCSTRPHEADFFPPPVQKTREGRYNHAGIPVLYLATNKLTCWTECRQPTSDFYVCRIEVRKSMRIVDLAQTEELEEELQALIFSSLMSAPSSDDSGWYQPQYVLTRFVADCVKANGVQGITYPSVRCGEGNNLVILDLKNLETWMHIDQIQEYSSRSSLRRNSETISPGTQPHILS
jgi:RES domain-containing protein